MGVVRKSVVWKQKGKGGIGLLGGMPAPPSKKIEGKLEKEAEMEERKYGF